MGSIYNEIQGVNLPRNAGVRLRGISNFNNTLQPCLIGLPNPAIDEVEILLINYREAEFNLSIVDLEGKILFNSVLKNGTSQNRISTEMLTPGVYIVEASYHGGIICRTKLIIVR